ncbi:MAG: ribonuclease HI family protein [Anaerolineales bacterium]|nr:ribonuclease HI family protein [Anaerolineales bacterium]
MILFQSRPKFYIVHIDGSIRPGFEKSGLAAIVRNENGIIIHWWSSQINQGMTCNEAEYAAAIMALEKIRALQNPPRVLKIYSDSQVLVHQMKGIATARAPVLRQSQMRLRGLVIHFEHVIFNHIPREKNRLADALANEAADDRETI